MHPLFLRARRLAPQPGLAAAPVFRRRPLATACLLATLAGAATTPSSASAQTSPAAAPSSASANPSAEPAAAQVLITGNPLGRNALAQPNAVLAGDALALRRAGTLGETLSGLAGVSSSDFGPQASRPVIRGLDGDRIRLLDNGGASADASNLSFDHAVAVDPLVIERIEVLRGPAALLYGGNATGGVVNALDNRIPRDALSGLGGRTDLRLGGAAAERSAAAVLEGGAGGLNWHVDAAQRRSGDLRTPLFTPLRDGQAEPATNPATNRATNRVINSGGNSRAGALGASWADAQGFAGLAYDDYRNDYGTTVEPDVSIRMQRQRLQLSAERRSLAGPISEASLQGSHTRYQHQEVAGDGTVGTTFSSRGSELRGQLKQAPLVVLGGKLASVLTGVLGLQLEQLDFAALGAEAFVPTTHSRSSGLFTLQELALPGITLSAGARLEQARVRSDGDAPNAATAATPANAHFGSPQVRDFSPRSYSVGAVLPLDQALGAGWRASATLGSTQRAPAYYELFADGPHLATGAYERGDAQQQVERSRHAELGLQWQQPGSSLQAAVFSTRFANYIALAASGALRPGAAGGQALPEYRFSGVPARLSGLELEAKQRLRSAPWQLDASANLDLVRGSNRSTGQALPRIAPARAQFRLDASQGAWRLGLQLRALARQDQVPASDSATPGALLVGLSASWQQHLAGADLLWYAKLDNLGDALAYNASTLPTARWLAPTGGRALSAGLRLHF